MTLTNLVSQIVHHSGFQLKDTLGKILFFPEIVGDCPSTCDLHYEPTVFPSLILEVIKREFGSEVEKIIRNEANNKLLMFLPKIIVNIDTILTWLVVKQQSNSAKNAVLSYFAAMKSLRLCENS